MTKTGGGGGRKEMEGGERTEFARMLKHTRELTFFFLKKDTPLTIYMFPVKHASSEKYEY